MATQIIRDYLARYPAKPVVLAAQEMGLPERDVLRQVENGAVTEVSGTNFDEVMSDVSKWGDITLIVNNAAAIIEVTASVPRGSRSNGFFNLHEKENPLGGHIRPEQIDSIFFVSRPFMGKESHSIQFYDQLGNCAFKIYLGRENDGTIKVEQLSRYIDLKHRCEK